ncbi:hypothetical protein [Nocardia sp. alder85J]|uniref:hypothetical protein n=1 Tax=Nocardia sp. alder85J TaxID=2862949 RepID=UPI001CD53249|nr:hypothetical protein [Nocardia sp. alder85J]MCX4098775.1 hypothetical protein [Nocardia sp. alder85J]
MNPGQPPPYPPLPHPLPGPGGAKPGAPDDVRTAWQLWWGVAAFGVLRLAADAVDRFTHRHDLARQMYDQMRAQQPQTSLASVELVVLLLEVVIVVFGLGLAVGVVAIAYQLRRGRLWARTLLEAAAAVLILGAVGTLFGLSTDGLAALLAGAATILQAVLAAGAVFLCRRGESEAFFRALGR